MTRIDAPVVSLADTSTDGGRGVFAGRNFRAGEVVETAPVIVLEIADTRRLRQTRLRTHDLDWQVQAKPADLSTAITTGYGGTYNHTDPASLRYRAGPAARTPVFTAVHDIGRDQQLTINYNARGGGHVWHDENGFMQENIRLITE